VVTNDIGNLEIFNPINKQDVGHRLPLWALAKTLCAKEEAGLFGTGLQFHGDKETKKIIVLNFNHLIDGINEKRQSSYTSLYCQGMIKYLPAKAPN